MPVDQSSLTNYSNNNFFSEDRILVETYKIPTEKFIGVEVIGWQDLLSSGSYATAREKGLLRTEGKEYVVKDGDVVEFRI